MMDGDARALTLSQPHVTAAEFSAHVKDGQTFAADALTVARREARNWRWGFLGMALAVGGMGVGVGALVTRHTEHWGVFVADTSTNTMRFVKDIHDTSFNLPAGIDEWFLERYVAMREGWSAADARSSFETVVCMSAPEEQKRFAAWHKDSPRAPQQVFNRARGGWRTVTTIAAPGTEGVSRDGARRVAVPFTWEDRGLNDGSPPRVSGTARFTVRKDVKARQPCNPSGLVIDEYSRQIDREPQS